MDGKVHVAIGTATVFCLCVRFPDGMDLGSIPIMPAISLVTAAAGSYAPDIDMGTTHAGKKYKTTSKIVSKVGGGHRGITHTLLVPAIVGILMYLVNTIFFPYKNILLLLESLLFGFEVGWLAHIFADLFNGKGCPLLWPIMRGKVHIMDLPSSGIVPWVFTVVYVYIVGYATFGGLFR